MEEINEKIKLIKLQNELSDVIRRGDIMELIEISKTKEDLIERLEMYFDITPEYREFVKNRFSSVYRMEE